MAKMTQKERILALLKRDARISVEELAARLAVAPSKIEKAIEELESDGTIVGYAAIVGDDQEKSPSSRFRFSRSVMPALTTLPSASASLTR